MAREGHAGARFQHSEQHRQPIGIPSDHGASRGAKTGRGNQRLDLNEQGPCAFDAGKDSRAGRRCIALSKKQFRRIGDFAQSPRHHFEHANFVRWPEAVFDGAQDSIGVASVAFEVEHGIDHVLDDFGSCDLAVFRDVANEQQCAARHLGVTNERLCGGAHLADGSGRGI